jgi:hypothetical protein
MAAQTGTVHLDRLSTSQTNVDGIGEGLRGEIEFQIEQSYAVQARRCERGAPYIFYRSATTGAHVAQGCCNDWTCPRCGQIRARREYGRIVAGAKLLADQGRTLYFWTLTCRGSDMPLETAENEYLKWTNRLLTAARIKAKRSGGFWAYTQVTERQTRKHPHSHLICTYAPDDGIHYLKGETLPNGRKAKHNLIWSEWFRGANVRAGLGVECDLSRIENPVAVAVYVSKYLFKDSITTKFQKGWRRIRYSRNYPKLPPTANTDAFPLVTLADWYKMERLGLVVRADTYDTYERALARGILCVIPPHDQPLLLRFR